MAASLRRMPVGAESTTTKFLFAVIKQLETKSVNWQQVADEMSITNGHAARMRYSRLKAQVEGVAPYGKAKSNPGDPALRKKRKTDIRTERKREAERLAAEKAAVEKESAIVKNEINDVDRDADGEADAEGETDETPKNIAGFDSTSEMRECFVRVKMEPEVGFTASYQA